MSRQCDAVLAPYNGRLDTTCRYYLGLDVRAVGEAHRKFMRYE